ncbi:gamma-glutamylcyclotransferase family protein [Variovorax fucosicus]|uniref:gamma-glutamylcyclotransferase family protein n=1 Tax=Variovorax fucosicus TaxID=3053517 RepID=UPI0025769E29|nr:gamma-glutamylcyclotransferase family protein [Variovorax sp. J22G47]MDM0058796.1 gamma-glutamylcyclotransferase family protein [Variovorax sp. J22G47]
MMPHQASAPRHVFVYGTLRAGGSNDIARLRPPPERVGDGAIAGTLYDLGAYPGAVLGGAGRVHGEIYRITPEVEAALDRLEEVVDDGSGEYIKRELLVVVNAVRLRCLVYEVHPDRVHDRPVIASGDWFRREFHG